MNKSSDVDLKRGNSGTVKKSVSRTLSKTTASKPTRGLLSQTSLEKKGTENEIITIPKIVVSAPKKVPKKKKAATGEAVSKAAKKDSSGANPAKKDSTEAKPDT
eukprot:Platyproteum_vivax@DN10294_c0_g1_i1.p2